MKLVSLYTQRIGSQQTLAFARACSVPQSLSVRPNTYSITTSERHAASFRLRLHLAALRSRPNIAGPRNTTPPNHALEPMRMSVTSAAYAPAAPATRMAQL